MTTQIGRNDPCPCGSGKKYKACCWSKQIPGKRKFKATVLSGNSNLMGRALGNNTLNADKPLEQKDQG